MDILDNILLVEEKTTGSVDVAKQDMQRVGVTEDNAKDRVMKADDLLFLTDYSGVNQHCCAGAALCFDKN